MLGNENRKRIETVGIHFELYILFVACCFIRFATSSLLSESISAHSSEMNEI